MIGARDLFKIGIGPSSSHTVGPMKAAAVFVSGLAASGLVGRVARVSVTLFGSLAWTGRGHGTDKAVMLGLAGHAPETVDPDEADALAAAIAAEARVSLPGGSAVGFELVLDRTTCGLAHPNTLAFAAFDAAGDRLFTERWCSVGGGFVLREADLGRAQTGGTVVPFPFRSGTELLRMGEHAGLSIAGIVAANERALYPDAPPEAHLEHVASAMMACIDRGLRAEGELPGGLRVRRRAPQLLRRAEAASGSNSAPPHRSIDLISVYAIAVNEENAAGGRVVTAPTNGAAGVIPAVLRHWRDHCPGGGGPGGGGPGGGSGDGIAQFLLTATAIGALFKMNASISGAEVGCQGEVGVACSMAAAGLAAALGGTNAQIENAAEIGMEHHLGMTCDPIGGLVQIPCIERNAFGAVKAITAASLALAGDGTHHVSLDRVIATMRATGADMHAKYKETSLGGLAVAYAEC
ncbi:MAG TPA: L-serine ammonia-lyase [Acetobacteraceae bacterium]|nr:L-serine ammonia-lyase [Acetobacteraceae bacterium]